MCVTYTVGFWKCWQVYWLFDMDQRHLKSLLCQQGFTVNTIDDSFLGSFLIPENTPTWTILAEESNRDSKQKQGRGKRGTPPQEKKNWIRWKVTFWLKLKGGGLENNQAAACGQYFSQRMRKWGTGAHTDLFNRQETPCGKDPGPTVVGVRAS